MVRPGAPRWRRWLGWLAGGGGALLTLGYALLFARGVYGRPDPRMTASLWVYQNVPPGSRILREEHDVKLPVMVQEPDNPLALQFGPHVYDVQTLALYTRGMMDSPAYYAEMLAGADYWLISSRSQHVTFRRLPQRFPVRACLYEKLFDGSLGFTLVRRFTRGPQLGPRRIDGEHDRLIEETFQVFDHPTVLLFARTGTPEEVERAMIEGCP